MTCPFCDSADVELVSPWGGQIITSQMRCLACNTYFEAIRQEFDPAESGSSTAGDHPPKGPIPFAESGSSTAGDHPPKGPIPFAESGSTPPV
jgi:hypothetical protein